MTRKSWYEPQKTEDERPKSLPPGSLPMPRALVGLPEGFTYTPREPVFFDELLRSEAAAAGFVKQHRGRRRDDEPKR